jgi:hypothetical protein
MVVEVLQLLVVIGLLVVEVLVEHHTIHYKEMVVLVVVELDMETQIEIFHHQLLESKIQVEVVVDFAYLHHLLSIVELQLVVPE